MYIGPDVIKAATGEIITHEKNLGGATTLKFQVMHTGQLKMIWNVLKSQETFILSAEAVGRNLRLSSVTTADRMEKKTQYLYSRLFQPCFQYA